jgi:hypothetical protein
MVWLVCIIVVETATKEDTMRYQKLTPAEEGIRAAQRDAAIEALREELAHHESAAHTAVAKGQWERAERETLMADRRREELHTLESE